MTIWIENAESKGTSALLVEVLTLCKQGESVQFLVPAGLGGAVVQRLRVTLSRSRKRNLARGRRVDGFTLHHSIYPYSTQGKRHDCVVMWTRKYLSHRARELLDDTIEGRINV